MENTVSANAETSIWIRKKPLGEKSRRSSGRNLNWIYIIYSNWIHFGQSPHRHCLDRILNSIQFSLRRTEMCWIFEQGNRRRFEKIRVNLIYSNGSRCQCGNLTHDIHKINENKKRNIHRIVSRTDKEQQYYTDWKQKSLDSQIHEIYRVGKEGIATNRWNRKLCLLFRALTVKRSRGGKERSRKKKKRSAVQRRVIAWWLGEDISRRKAW